MESPRFAIIRGTGRIVPHRQWHVHDYRTGCVARLDNPDEPQGPLAYFSEQRFAEEWLSRHEPLQRIGCDLCDRLFTPDDEPCRHLANAEERAVWAEATQLAEACGCRRADVHKGVAHARREIRAELSAGEQELGGFAPYFCPTSGNVEDPSNGGFDVCCDRPDLHQAIPTTGSTTPGHPEKCACGECEYRRSRATGSSPSGGDV